MRIISILGREKLKAKKFKENTIKLYMDEVKEGLGYMAKIESTYL